MPAAPSTPALVNTRMLTNESLVDIWIDRAAEYYGDSDLRLKMAGIVSDTVVGKYKLGGTSAIAKKTKHSVASVQNWAHAFRLYKTLRVAGGRLGGFFLVRSLWRSLPASHWWLAYDIQQSGFDALYYLENAELHHWSGRDMMQEYKREREGGLAPLVFHHACHSFLSLANELSKRSELTQGQKKAIELVRKEFGEVTE